MGQNPIFAVRERDPFLPKAPSGDVLPLDVDGDGAIDLLVDEGVIVFYRNEGPGKFVRLATSPGRIDGREAVGDVDGDGDLDFVGVPLYRNVGGGQFLKDFSSLAGIVQTNSSVLFDFDADGDLDLAVLGLLPFGLRLMTNDGTGHFTDATATVLQSANNTFVHYATLDVERDGDIDLVAIRGTFLVEAVLLRNNGQGVFAEELIPIQPLFGVAPSVMAADLDGDGDQDFMIGPVTQSPVDLYLNDGTGVFARVPNASPPPVYFAPEFVVFADWDQDGRADLLDFEGVWRHTGNFQYFLTTWPLRAWAFQFPWAVDIDGDLDLDRVADSRPVSVTMNTSAGAIHATTTAVSAGLAMERFFGDARSLIVEGGFTLALYRVQLGTLTQRNAVLVPLFFNLSGPVTSVAPFSRSSGAVVCQAAGPKVYREQGSVMVEQVALPVSPTATHVAIADLLGDIADEIVLGDPTIHGPQILSGNPVVGYQQNPLLGLPPPIPSNAPVAETVLIADMNGDGIKDIVHELRVLQHNGSGTWTQVAQFPLQVGPTSTDLLAIDFDDDGDQDLVVWGGQSPTLLLRNDGSHFVDVSLGRIPSADIAPAQVVSKGDVDGDGDDDLLVARLGRSNLLRNDNGVFTRVPSVAPTGVLVDIDEDGRADVFTGQEVLYSMYASLHAPRLALPGTDWLLQVSSWRQGPLPHLALITVGTPAPVPLSIPGYGKLHVDMATADVFPVVLMAGRGETVLQIPNTPLALGIDLAAQAAVIDPHRIVLTAPVFDAVR